MAKALIPWMSGKVGQHRTCKGAGVPLVLEASDNSHFKHMKVLKLEIREATIFGVTFSPLSYPQHGQGRVSSPLSFESFEKIFEEVDNDPDV